MPLTGTHTVLSAARRAARNGVRDTYAALAAARPLTASELAQMAVDIDNAIAAADIAHWVANTTVVVTSVAGVTTGPGVSGPGAGTIT